MDLTNNTIFIFSGEHSGDVHGGKLVESLKKQKTKLSFEGVAGPLMRAEGVKTLLNMEDFLVMGFKDVLYALPKLYNRFRKIRNYIISNNPKAIILIDYQEFSYLLSRSLRKKGYTGKIIQYISPSVWAWRPKRAYKLAKYLDLLLTIYPFEKQYYTKTSLNVQYIGNPILEKTLTYSYTNDWKRSLHIPDQTALIGIFPGSRRSEIKNNLPLFIQSSIDLKTDFSFGISSACDACTEQIQDILETFSLSVRNRFVIVPRHYSYELMKACSFAFAKSGTVTLELALHQKPTVVAYEVSKFHKFICKNILNINLPFYCIVNILSQKLIFPEFIDHHLKSQTISDSMKKLIATPSLAQSIIASCHELHQILSTSHTDDCAAKAILEAIS